MNKGRLFIISAPSGTGKSTVLARLKELRPDMWFSVSATTRPQRKGEVDGREYLFVDRSTFQQMIDDGAFVEWAEVHGERYGTPRAKLESMLAAGDDVLLDIDVQGGMAIKGAFPDAITVFLLPPNMAELERRLSGRATDSPEQIALRLSNAQRELAFKDRYDRTIVNDRIEQAADELIALVDEATRKA